MTGRTYTHPDVLGAGVRRGWADPETDPTRIEWAERQARAAIPFRVVDGRPVNPCESTGIRYGRNEFGHWGEALMADALVTIKTDDVLWSPTEDPTFWLMTIERRDGHGWAVPGGHVEPGETPLRDGAVAGKLPQPADREPVPPGDDPWTPPLSAHAAGPVPGLRGVSRGGKGQAR